MKGLLSILFFLAFAGYSRAENFDSEAKLKNVWFFAENIQNSAILEWGIFDEQDSNEFTGPDFFLERTGTNAQIFKREIKKVYVFSPCIFITSLQYSLIDLPPPSFS